MNSRNRLGNTIEINHGGGGKRMDALIHFILDNMEIEEDDDVPINSRNGDDAAFVELTSPVNKLIVSTDSHTVDPIFYRGGNIGDLSVVGTVNDVTVMGAKPLYLTLGMIIEEGYKIDDIGKIATTIGKRAKETGIKIVTGDTKVMPRGMLSNIVTNTSGIGVLIRDKPLADSDARPGDLVIITGNIGDHGTSLMSLREGIEFDTDLESDVNPFWPYFEEILRNPKVHCMKDLTRGGLASALNDIASSSKVLIEIEEQLIPIRQEAQAICDMLGLEILEISSEGRAIIVCDPEVKDDVLTELKKHELSKDAIIIGEIKRKPKSRVHVITEIGGTRLLDKPYGEPIPRVC